MSSTVHAAAILRAAFTAHTQGQELTPTEAQLAFDTAKLVSASEANDAQDQERLALVMAYAEPYLTVSPPG